MSIQNKIVFTATIGALDADSWIYTINPDGTGLTQITAAGLDLWFYALASPDGEKLLAMRNVSGSFDLFLMDADGGGSTQITNMHPNAQTSVAPTFSPDGSKFVLPYGSPTAGSPPGGVCIVNTDNSGFASFPVAGIGTGNVNTRVYWSPDGAKFAYPDFTGASGLGVSTCHTDGSNITPVMDDASNWYDVFGWYPDSSTLLINAMGTTTPFPVKVMKSDGSILVSDPTEAVWAGAIMDLSQDGSEIVFFAGDLTLNIFDGSVTRLVVPPPYPVGGINGFGGSYLVQWVGTFVPLVPAVSSIVAGQHTTGLVRLG